MKKKGLEQVKPKALSTYKGTGQPQWRGKRTAQVPWQGTGASMPLSSCCPSGFTLTLTSAPRFWPATERRGDANVGLVQQDSFFMFIRSVL